MREKLIELIQESVRCVRYWAEVIADYLLANRIIDTAPAADVAEVVHGEWLENDGRCYCNRCFEFSCTVMDDTGTIYNDLTKFCPNCGAKMDGGRKES